MLARLLFLFLTVPAVELALLLQIGQRIGFWPTVGIIVVTGVVGSYLAKREGLAAWKRLNDKLGRGGLPGRELMDGVIILMAGALLLTPGVLTDVVGLLGLLPPSRALIRRYVLKRIERKMQHSTGTASIQWGFFGGPGGGNASSTDAPSAWDDLDWEPVEEADWEETSSSETKRAPSLPPDDTAR
ncbi:FxsA family protein [Salisaeta longa]|uniref:FxsA family protein n=1 Tax=Salisaeta longa TaxID=503170 RepID=UPI0003B6F581|nr:FxsA family protein [Salisaeta longa]